MTRKTLVVFFVAGATLAFALDEIEAVRPRSRRVEIREVRLSPRRVTTGGRVVATARLVSVGSLPVRGPITLETEAGAVNVPFGPLAPGEEVVVRTELVARATKRARLARAADEGPYLASSFVVDFHVAGVSTTASAQIVSPLQHVPGLEIVAVEKASRIDVTVENTGTDEERSGFVRIVGPGHESLTEQPLPRLAAGERATIALGPRGGALQVTVEAFRRPPGFRETVEDRRPLVLDPPDPVRRHGARR
jgi:hypothetical protein